MQIYIFFYYKMLLHMKITFDIYPILKKKKRVTMTGVYANIRAHFLVFLVASLCKRVCMTTDVPTHMWHVAIYFLSNQYGICCLHRTDMQMLNSMLRMLQLSLKMDNKIISIKNGRSLMSDTSPYFPEKNFFQLPY